MDPRLEQVLADEFSGVLAHFAFVFGDRVTPDLLPGLEGRGFAAMIPFRGDLVGSLAVAVPEALAVDIAANTLGVELGDPSAARGAEDVVKELASILGGHLATTFGGRVSKLDLEPPTLLVLDAEEWKRLSTDPSTQCYAVNERPALLCVRLQQGGVSE